MTGGNQLAVYKSGRGLNSGQPSTNPAGAQGGVRSFRYKSIRSEVVKSFRCIMKLSVDLLQNIFRFAADESKFPS